MKAFRVYKTSQIVGTTEDGGKLEWAYGCNGETHAADLNEVYYSNAEVVFAKGLATLHVGVCDGTCTSHDLGFFALVAKQGARNIPA